SPHDAGKTAQRRPGAPGEPVGFGPLVRGRGSQPAHLSVGERSHPSRRSVPRAGNMSLSPDSRVLLTEALHPPPGYTVDVAVGTTYSLDLTALLLAPMSFALFEHTRAGHLEAVDPIRLLDPVRRHAGRTKVFCEAVAIAIPGPSRSIFTLVESSMDGEMREGG